MLVIVRVLLSSIRFIYCYFENVVLLQRLFISVTDKKNPENVVQVSRTYFYWGIWYKFLVIWSSLLLSFERRRPVLSSRRIYGWLLWILCSFIFHYHIVIIMYIKTTHTLDSRKGSSLAPEVTDFLFNYIYGQVIVVWYLIYSTRSV